PPRAGLLSVTLSREGLPARLYPALDIAGLARCATEILELVVMGLELVIGDTPVLDRHVRGQEFFAVALGQPRFHLKVARQKAPSLRVPMHASATDAIRRHER